MKDTEGLPGWKYDEKTGYWSRRHRDFDMVVFTQQTADDDYEWCFTVRFVRGPQRVGHSQWWNAVDAQREAEAALDRIIEVRRGVHSLRSSLRQLQSDKLD